MAVAVAAKENLTLQQFFRHLRSHRYWWAFQTAPLS